MSTPTNTPTPLDTLIARLEAIARRYEAQQLRQTATAQDAAVEAKCSLAANAIHDRIRCAQSLRAGCLPDSGALNDVRLSTQEARYAAFN